MKKFITLTAVLISVVGFGQKEERLRLTKDGYLYVLHSDTLIISANDEFHFIKVGDKVYKIKQELEEVNEILRFGYGEGAVKQLPILEHDEPINNARLFRGEGILIDSTLNSFIIVKADTSNFIHKRRVFKSKKSKISRVDELKAIETPYIKREGKEKTKNLLKKTK